MPQTGSHHNPDKCVTLVVIHEEIFRTNFGTIMKNLTNINVLQKISPCIAFCHMKKNRMKNLPKNLTKNPMKKVCCLQQTLKSYQIMVRFLVAEPIRNRELCVIKSDGSVVFM